MFFELFRLSVPPNNQDSRGIGSNLWRTSIIVPFHKRCGLALSKAVADNMRSTGRLRWNLRGSGDGNADDQQRVAHR